MDYRMPQARLGQIVEWYAGGTRAEKPCCAIVKVPSHSSLHLKVFGAERDFDQTCVHHIDDPTTKEFDKNAEGCWDFLDCDKPKKGK